MILVRFVEMTVFNLKFTTCFSVDQSHGSIALEPITWQYCAWTNHMLVLCLDQLCGSFSFGPIMWQYFIWTNHVAVFHLDQTRGSVVAEGGAAGKPSNQL